MLESVVVRCLWPLESHGRPEPRPPPAAPWTSSHSCSSSTTATGSSHRSRTVRVVITLMHVNWCWILTRGYHCTTFSRVYPWAVAQLSPNCWATARQTPSQLKLHCDSALMNKHFHYWGWYRQFLNRSGVAELLLYCTFAQQLGNILVHSRIKQKLCNDTI